MSGNSDRLYDGRLTVVPREAGGIPLQSREWLQHPEMTSPPRRSHVEPLYALHTHRTNHVSVVTTRQAILSMDRLTGRCYTSVYMPYCQLLLPSHTHTHTRSLELHTPHSHWDPVRRDNVGPFGSQSHHSTQVFNHHQRNRVLGWMIYQHGQSS